MVVEVVIMDAIIVVDVAGPRAWTGLSWTGRWWERKRMRRGRWNAGVFGGS